MLSTCLIALVVVAVNIIIVGHVGDGDKALKCLCNYITGEYEYGMGTLF